MFSVGCGCACAGCVLCQGRTLPSTIYVTFTAANCPALTNLGSVPLQATTSAGFFLGWENLNIPYTCNGHQLIIQVGLACVNIGNDPTPSWVVSIEIDDSSQTYGSGSTCILFSFNNTLAPEDYHCDDDIFVIKTVTMALVDPACDFCCQQLGNVTMFFSV